MSAVAALGLSTLAACTNSSSSSSSPGPAGTSHATITIGASLSLTGDFAADDVAFQRGYQLWAKDVNAHGGIGGRPVKLIIKNDQSSPNQVVTNYQALFGDDHVDLAFGPFSWSRSWTGSPHSRRAIGRKPRPTRWPRTRSPTRRCSSPRRC